MNNPQINALYQQAHQAYGSRNYRAALQLSQKLISLAGPREEFLNIKGMSQFGLGEISDAANTMTKAIKKNPRAAGLRLNAARIDQELGRLRQGKRQVMEAVRLSPRDPKILYQAAFLCQKLMDYQQADRLLARTQSLAPDFADAWHLRGSLFLDQGKHDEALEQLRHCLNINPALVLAAAELAKIETDESSLDQLKQSLITTTEQSRSAVEQRSAHFALAGMAYRNGDHKEAAVHYAQANRAAALSRPVSETDWKAKLDQWEMQMREKPLQYAQLKPLGPPGQGPGSQLIFIVGMPRSGTSLCEQILGAHPEVLAGGELTAMENAEQLSGPKASIEDRRRTYFDGLPRGWEKYRYVTDKLPKNHERIGLIHEMFPGARFIHCERDFMDTVFSCYQQEFQSAIHWSNDPDDIARVAIAERQIMAFWQEKLPDHILPLRYEDVVSDLPVQTERLTDFLDIPPYEGMENPHEQTSTVATSSRLQVRQAVYTSSVGKWRPYEASLQPAMKRLKAFQADS